MYNESTLPKWYPDGTIFGLSPHPVTVTNEGWFFRDFATKKDYAHYLCKLRYNHGIQKTQTSF